MLGVQHLIAEQFRPCGTVGPGLSTHVSPCADKSVIHRTMLLRFKVIRPYISSNSIFTSALKSRKIYNNTISTIMSNRAAFVESEKGPIVVRDAEISELGEGEVLMKVFASAIQPADAKVAKLALIPMEYPTILGSPVAGVVEAVGAGVTKVSVGERVVSGTKIFSHKKAKYGGLQRFSIVDASEIVEVRKEVSLSINLANKTM
jgi:hypothetical protein